MSSFLFFFLSLEGFFLCSEFYGGQTGMRVYLDDLALLIHSASISRGDEVLERGDDDTGWGRGERGEVDSLVLVCSVVWHGKGQRVTCRGSVVDSGHSRRGMGQIRKVDVESRIRKKFAVGFAPSSPRTSWLRKTQKYRRW